MRSVAAPLAAALATVAFAACGGGGAEPGASDEATLMLDFQPNAVHTGIYEAEARGYYDDAGISLTIREPSSATDAPKLLAAGRAEFAILDIHDLAIARERGLEIVGVGAIVDRPLAAVIARDREAVRTPRDLEGGTVGVTGLPSDDAVLDSVLEAGGADPAAVDRVTIGFDAVSALSAGRIDAATAFWNAEGVALRGLGIPTREFRVDDFGAPRYPELVLATSAETPAEKPSLVGGMVDATAHGYADVVAEPGRALDDLVAAVPGLDRTEQGDQLQSLLAANAIGRSGGLDREILDRWADWDLEHGIVEQPIDVDALFAPPGEDSG